MNSSRGLRVAVEELVRQTANEHGPVEMWTRPTIEKFQEKALEITLSSVQSSRFFQEKFRANSVTPSIESWSSLPITETVELKNRLDVLLACDWSDVAQINMSSGTTGGPTTYVAFTEDDLRNDGNFYADRGLFAFEPGELVFVALPYDMATVGFAIHNDVRRQGAAVLPAGKGGTYSSPERLIGAIHDLRPQTLFSTPSYAYYLSELYKETWPDDDLPLERVRVGGEGASPAFLALLARSWGAEVTQWYGSTEAGPIAYTCEKGEYHQLVANVYMEILDDSGRPTPDGSPGWVVLTTLGREATPIVRLRTGDRGLWIGEDCLCGRKLPLFRHLGRESDQLNVRGRKISPIQIENVLIGSSAGFSPWYEIFDADDTLIVRSEGIPGETIDVGKLQQAFDSEFGNNSMSIEVAATDTLARPATKMTRVKRKP